MLLKPFFQTPAGATERTIPLAAMADTATSRQLISDKEPDAFYFRALEAGHIVLNGPQIEAVRHHQGPLLTLAGAGSGKTTVLICRTGYLMAVRGVPARQILLLTFSSRAAAEMKERLAGLPGISGDQARLVEARTFHSFFLYFLRRQGIQEEIFSETFRQHMLLKQIMRSMNLADSYQPETLLSVLSAHKMNMAAVESLPERDDQERELKSIFSQYEEWKRQNNKIDFDDVLLHAYQLLQEQPHLLRSLQSRFQYVMNDEFQDTNLLQYELVRMLALPENNLMAVGDDDQTIYTFNGARSEFILDFDKQYPDARVITLDVNYRSSDSIIGLGNEIIRKNVKRRLKTLKSVRTDGMSPRYLRPNNQEDEAAAILQEIEAGIAAGARSYGDFAVLYRSASNGRAIIEQLAMKDMPYVDFGDGQLLYEHGVVRPLLAHLRLSLHRRDFEAMEQLLPSLYLNRDKGMEHIRRQDAPRPVKGPLAHLLSFPGLKEFQQTKIRERVELIRSLPKLAPAAAIRLMRQSFYDAYLDTNSKQQLTLHKETLREMLDEVEQSASRFATVEEFITYIDEVAAKVNASARSKRMEQGDRIALMTIHKSKGLEFPVVFVIGASEGSLPHSSALAADQLPDAYVGQAQSAKEKSGAALEEERRLAYVAVTRAKEELFISSPSQYRGKTAAVSRFVLGAFQRPGSSGDPSPASRPGKLDQAGRQRQGQGQRRPAVKAAPPHKSHAAAAGGQASPGHNTGQGPILRRPGPMETVQVWVCTKPGCKAWSRISSSAGQERPDRACPLCSSPMKRGNREVPG